MINMVTEYKSIKMVYIIIIINKGIKLSKIQINKENF